MNNTLYWAKEFFYNVSFSVGELNEIGETEFESRRLLNFRLKNCRPIKIGESLD